MNEQRKARLLSRRVAKDALVAQPPGDPETPTASTVVYKPTETPAFTEAVEKLATPGGPPDPTAADLSYVQRVEKVSSSTYRAYSTLPVTPARAEVPDLATFACGLYLSPAPTAAGKTINMTALLLTVKPLFETVYHYVYEARSVPPPASVRPLSEAEAAMAAMATSFKGMMALQSALSRSKQQAAAAAIPEAASAMSAEGDNSRVALFSDPSKLLDDLAFIYGKRNTASKPIFVVIDSMTLAIKQAFPYERSGQGTGEKGSQPADIKFIYELSRFSLERNIVMVGLVNSLLVQFTDILEGVAEGQLSIAGVGQLQKRDRISRDWKLLSLSPKMINEAAAALGYERSNSSSTSTYSLAQAWSTV